MKNSVNFVQVKDIVEKLENIKERASRQGARGHKRGNSQFQVNQSIAKRKDMVIATGFKDINQFYLNAFTHEQQPIQVRSGTPISDAYSNDFPSPRVGGNEEAQKNYDVLPNFTEDKDGRKIDSDAYLNESFKTIARSKKLKVVKTNKHSHKGDGSMELLSDTKVP